MPFPKAVAFQAPVRVSYVAGANAALLDTFLFCALDGDYELVAVSEVHDVAGTDGGAVTVDVVKCASGTTVASGTTMLASTFNLKSTADTPVIKKASSGLTTTLANRRVSQGQSVALNFAGTLDGLTGIAVNAVFVPVGKPSW